MIGAIGTAARLLVGLALLGSVLQGELAGRFRPAAWVLGLVGFPAVLLAWQWWWARHGRPRLRATGPLGHGLNIAVFLALYLTPWYAPALRFTSDAALLSSAAPFCWPHRGATPAARSWQSPTGCSAATTRSAAWCSRPSTSSSATCATDPSGGR